MKMHTRLKRKHGLTAHHSHKLRVKKKRARTFATEAEAISYAKNNKITYSAIEQAKKGKRFRLKIS